ncbi:MAG TPA: HAD-IB family hydrolase [Gammaproteobacteria bacterium]|nr:HAD-IB family hydrolase [Gammaproteobacteria bacterium]
MKLAIFDIDGTLVEGSTERRFWRYLLKRGHQGPRQVLAYLVFWLRYFPVYRGQTAKKNKAYLYKLGTARVRALAERFVAEEILPRLYAPAVQRLQSHLRRGDTVVLLSGTLEPIARALAKALAVEHVRATVCRERGERYLAGPPTVHPFGAAKLEIAVQFAAEVGADLREASAYGDSRHDLTLLEAVGDPVAVLPDRPLLETARGNRWLIIRSRNAPHVFPQ